VLASLQIRLSDREACSYLAIGSGVAVRFAVTIVVMSSRGGTDVVTSIRLFGDDLDVDACQEPG